MIYKTSKLKKSQTKTNVVMFYNFKLLSFKFEFISTERRN